MKFSQFPQQVIDENVDYTVKEITNIIKKYGPRESGNSNCLAAEKHIKKEMDPFCDECAALVDRPVYCWRCDFCGAVYHRNGVPVLQAVYGPAL